MQNAAATFENEAYNTTCKEDPRRWNVHIHINTSSVGRFANIMLLMLRCVWSTQRHYMFCYSYQLGTIDGRFVWEAFEEYLFFDPKRKKSRSLVVVRRDILCQMSMDDSEDKNSQRETPEVCDPLLSTPIQNTFTQWEHLLKPIILRLKSWGGTNINTSKGPYHQILESAKPATTLILFLFFKTNFRHHNPHNPWQRFVDHGNQQQFTQWTSAYPYGWRRIGKCSKVATCRRKPVKNLMSLVLNHCFPLGFRHFH